jgi:hypothetical protein
MFFANNLGTLNLAFFFYLGMLLATCYYKSYKNSSKRSKRKYKALKKFVFYEFIIKTIMESYSTMAVCGFISLYYIRFGTSGETI